jgi:seryl-tRNA synthetase
MDQAIKEILIEAARTRQRKEPVERAVGRAVRRRGMDFQSYIAAMSDLRDMAASQKVDLEKALKKLAECE